MLSLRELQQRAYDAFIFSDDQALAPFVEAGTGDSLERISVYRNNARENFIGTLSTSYPVIKNLVGEACFSSLAIDYYKRFPSRHGNLAVFGMEFPRLLDNHFANSAFSYLSDVATLELSIEQVHGAAYVSSIDLALLQRSAGDNFPLCRLQIGPSVRVLRSQYPVLAIWKAHQEGDTGSIDANAGADHLLVRQVNDGVEIRRISPAVWFLLDRLQLGETLGCALSQALDDGIHIAGENPLLEIALPGLFSDVDLHSDES